MLIEISTRNSDALRSWPSISGLLRIALSCLVVVIPLGYMELHLPDGACLTTLQANGSIVLAQLRLSIACEYRCDERWLSSAATARQHVEHFQGLAAVIYIVRGRPERGVLLDYAS